MPKFQARYFSHHDQATPSRVDPVEAASHDAALAIARLRIAGGEMRVELAEMNDELNRSVSDPHGAVDAIYTRIGETIGMAHDRIDEARETATTAVKEVERFVRARPYAAIGIGALLAYLVGLHVGAGGKNVIYLKDER